MLGLAGEARRARTLQLEPDIAADTVSGSRPGHLPASPTARWASVAWGY
jgi:hypothetical protein